MHTFLTVIHVVMAIFMILVVLVQGGNQGGMSAAFGGGNSAGVFGATGATSFLGKLTYGAAAVFMITSISLTILDGKGGDIGAAEKIKALAPAADPAAAPAAPAAGTAAPAATPAPATTPAPVTK